MRPVDELVYRPFEEEDLDQVAELFREQWCSELDQRLGKVAAQATVCNYLMDADWGCVTELRGDVLGVALMASGNKDAVSRTYWRGLRDETLAQVGPRARFGIEVGAVEYEEGQLAHAYAQEGGACSDTEVKLLIVSPRSQGLGLGRALIEKCGRRAKDLGRRGFFLITDDTCDVGFYDHMGLMRQMKAPSEAEPQINLYVYAKELG